MALAHSGCGDQPAAGPAKGGGKGGRGGGAAPVVVGQVVQKPVPLVIEAIGAVEPIRNTSIRSQVTGTLMKIVMTEGRDVKQGDVLFEIDPRPFRNALQSAQADVEKTRVLLESAQTQVARYRALTADQMVSKEQFEKIQDSARSLAAEMQANEARLATARIQLEYCTIRAPQAGRTGNINVREGDIVRANDAGAPLVTINQLSPIYVTFGVPQQYLALLTRYQSAGALKVKVVPPGVDENPEVGELTFIDNTVDPSTGTLKLKGTFPNTSNRLWPGQFATVTLTLAAPEVLAIPGSAIQTSQAGQHVYVVKADKTAEFRPVVVERSYGDDAVIARGLAVGETVVTDGQLRVVPGRPVEIKGPAVAPATGASKAGGERKKKEKSAS